MNDSEVRLVGGVDDAGDLGGSLWLTDTDSGVDVSAIEGCTVPPLGK
jgi:hypothetical protein